MRSVQQMMDLILSTAVADERVRAVIMNGSRANPKAKKDFFQDYDIVYVVRDIDSYLKDHGWIKIFGELMILQMPKKMQMIPDVQNGSFTYLMQFTDGNRIDLTLIPIEMADELVERESQSILLLDKDNLIDPFPPASDSDFHIKKPTEQFYKDCCNEFWWICPYVAKGIWRDELPYAMFTYDRYLRDMLIQMVEWYIGIKTDFSISSGKHGKHFKDYLEPELWEQYTKTYSDGNYEHLWEALFVSCDLFRTLACKIGEYFHFTYPFDDDRRVMVHLHHVRTLPADARGMYE